MQDLKDVTNNVHYENYRSSKLAAVTYNGVDNNKNKGQLTKWVDYSGCTPTVHINEKEAFKIILFELAPNLNLQISILSKAYNSKALQIVFFFCSFYPNKPALTLV